MENIIINFSANIQPLISLVDELQKTGQITQQAADKFKALGAASSKAVSDVKTPLTQLNQTLKETGQNVSKAFILDTGNNIAKNVNHIQSLRTAIKQATGEFIFLRRQSELGLISTQKVDEAAAKVGALKREFKEAQETIAALDPQAKFTAIGQAARGIAGGFVAAQGALALFGTKSQEVEEAILKVQGALALSQGLNELLQLGDAFKNIKSLLGITTAAIEAQAVAQTVLAGTTIVEAEATTAATVATKGFTAALLTNPIFLIVAALSALVGAYLLLKDSQEDNIELTSKEIEAENKRADSLRAIKDEIAGVKLEIDKLNGTKSELQVNIELNQKKFESDLKKLAEDKKVAEKKIQEELDKTTPKKFELVTISSRTNKEGDIIEQKRRQETEASIRARQKERERLLKQEEDFAGKEIALREKLAADNLKSATEAGVKGGEKARDDADKLAKEREAFLKQLQDRQTALQIEGIIDADERKIAQINLDFGKEKRAIEEGEKKKLFSGKPSENASLAADALAKNEKDRQGAISRVQKEGAERRLHEAAQQAKDADAQNKKIDADELQAALDAIDLATSQQILKLREQIAAKKNITKQEQEKLNQEIAVLEIKGDAEKQQKIIDSTKKGTKERVDAEIKLQDDIAKLNKLGVDNFISAEEEKRRAFLKTVSDIKAGFDEVGELGNQLANVFKTISDARIQTLEEEKNATLAKDQEEIDSFNAKIESRGKRLTKEQLELKKLNDKKAADEKKINAEIAEQKNKAAKQQHDFAVFQATLNVAEVILKNLSAFPLPYGAIIAAIAGGLATAQLVAIINTPVPKFHKGRLAQTDPNEEMALIRKDETIFDPEQSKQYAPTFRAIYHKQIKPDILNDYVNLKLKNSFAQNVHASLDSMKLAYDIAYVLRDQKVIVGNADEIVKGITSAIPQQIPPYKW